jgi:NAD(P)-dependent dehydrogenase (short-subunit alcohol dehydrogenase family)
MLSTHRLDQVAVAGQATVRHVGGDLERALITGVAGFIGSHLAAELLRQGWLVTGVDTRSPASDPVAAENLAELMRDSRFQFASADVVAGDLAMLLEGVRAVFHLAAHVAGKRIGRDDARACSLQATVEPAEEVRPMNAVWMWVLPLPLHGRNGRLT